MQLGLRFRSKHTADWPDTGKECVEGLRIGHKATTTMSHHIRRNTLPAAAVERKLQWFAIRPKFSTTINSSIHTTQTYRFSFVFLHVKQVSIIHSHIQSAYNSQGTLSRSHNTATHAGITWCLLGLHCAVHSSQHSLHATADVIGHRVLL